MSVSAYNYRLLQRSIKLYYNLYIQAITEVDVHMSMTSYKLLHNYSLLKLQLSLPMYVGQASDSSKVVFISLLVVDMLNTILQETITLSKGDRVRSARAAIVVFVLCMIILFGPLTIGHYVYLCIARKNPVSFITSLLEIWECFSFSMATISPVLLTCNKLQLS